MTVLSAKQFREMPDYISDGAFGDQQVCGKIYL